MAQRERPLGGYTITMSVYGALVAAFGVWFHRSGRELPDTVAPGDLALLTVASHKLSRIVTKDKITAPVRAPFTEHQEDSGHGEVEEAARGTGMQRTIGELLVCPYCVSVWIATAFAAGFATVPRLTRQVTAVFSAMFGSDLLQLLYVEAKKD